MAILETVKDRSKAECDALVQKAVHAIRCARCLPSFSAFSDRDLARWCIEAESGLQMWIAGDDSAVVNMIYHDLGRTGAAHGVHVPELVNALMLVFSVARSEPHAMDPTREGRASEPLSAFCDYARYYLLRGYEDALR